MTYHVPVLMQEVCDALNPQAFGKYIDGTVGEGGHSEAILASGSPGCRLFGIDADPEAIDSAWSRLAKFGSRVVLEQSNFVSITELATEAGFVPCDGIIMDLGLSSLQLEGEGRGFSFQREGPLDMRFDPRQERTGAQVINNYSGKELQRIFEQFGELRNARRIAEGIVEMRPFYSSLGLANFLYRLIGRHGRIHPATKVFQAVRIEVNRELQALESGLNQVIKLLGRRRRLAVISYHSLEDRIVKRVLARAAAQCVCPPKLPVCMCQHIPEVKLVTKKPMTPSWLEIKGNPRSRSARLRVAEHV
ncbi:16S rRNA (cytosine(1402)-N(4))-methyltransferase RsmH [SAR202 cluster bacterium AD-802-E10_MRT_200m]|nr:16S rRNA (cytosine(1402)-N(4))-methyltransferase RsmH [SAR202 cluster bacterium AD-802-E10_MRT_200m]